MSPSAIVLLVVTWSVVTSLTGYLLYRVTRLGGQQSDERSDSAHPDDPDAS